MCSAEFTQHDRIFIAKSLSRIGVEYIELVNPMASSLAFEECSRIANLGLDSKVLTHIRAHMDDVRAAVKTGVDGVNIYMATSPQLAPHSHGKNIKEVIARALDVVQLAKEAGKEVRFSCEDAFRSNLDDILTVYKAMAEAGVDRVGVADTVGVATPPAVRHVMARVRATVGPTCGIEFHTHNDTGCAVSNAYMALLGGATHIDTTVLGIGERNGITPLGAFLARMYTLDSEAVKSRYNLHLIAPLEKYVANVAKVQVPFNTCVTGSAAFTHKAGVHSKAVIADPGTYEVLNPADFGVDRHIQLAHRLTGWNAIWQRAKDLQLDLTDDEIRAATSLIKNQSDERSLSLTEIDQVLVQLAAGPRTSSSSFVRWSKDSQLKEAMDGAEGAAQHSEPEVADAAAEVAAALAKFEAAQAKRALRAVTSRVKSQARPSLVLRITGHLFDTNLINKLTDLLVLVNVDFTITELVVPNSNDELTDLTVLLRAQERGGSQEDLDDARARVSELIEEYKGEAKCTIAVMLNPSKRPVA